MKNKLATINAIWIGPNLGPVHAACLQSFINQGHRVVLHTYECLKDKPEGVEYADANLLIPEDQKFIHRKTGSFAVFTDLLRYEILRQNLGLYVDCDIFCLKPIHDTDYIVGFQDSTINNAVLKMPADCPALQELCAMRHHHFLPPWFSSLRRWKFKIRRLWGGGQFPRHEMGNPRP
ncbi:MAG: glycosyltransferase [Roseovarius sp.]|nr:glycosyltransferase [Roseovarius sp.]